MASKSLFIVVFASFFGLLSCNKYPDGPKLSLRTKKERIANKWVIEQAFRNGQDVTNEYSQYTLETDKDGDAKLTAKFTFFGTVYEWNTTGSWNFNGNKTKIIFNYENDDADESYTLLKLMENELWVRDSNGDDELHLVPG